MKPSDNNLRTVKYQYFATFAGDFDTFSILVFIDVIFKYWLFILFKIANIVTFNFGIGLGWFSPALPMLQSDESPLETGALTISDVSWIGSIFITTNTFQKSR